MTPSEIFLTIAFDIIPQSDIMELLRDFGYDEEPSVSLLFRAFEEKGDEFMHEFGELCLANADSPLLEARFRQVAGGLNKMSNAEKAQLTEDQKQQRVKNGLEWFKEGSTVLIQIIGGAAAWTAQANGTAASQYDAERAAAEATAQAEKTRQYLIFGALVFLVFVLLSFMFYRMFSGK